MSFVTKRLFYVGICKTEYIICLNSNLSKQNNSEGANTYKIDKPLSAETGKNKYQFIARLMSYIEEAVKSLHVL